MSNNIDIIDNLTKLSDEIQGLNNVLLTFSESKDLEYRKDGLRFLFYSINRINEYIKENISKISND